MSHLNFFNNFFDILKIPTLVLNKDCFILSSYKHADNLKDSLYNSKAINYLKTLDFNPGILTLDISEEIKYTCISFYHCGSTAMYILIGPYTHTPEQNADEVLHVTNKQIDTLIDLYSFIIDNKCCIHKPETIKSPCIDRAIEYIELNYASDISIDTLCSELNINKCYFCSVLKKEMGTTFINYLNAYKIEKSKELLKNPGISLLDVAIDSGFNNQSYYSKVFKKITSKTPLEYREEVLSS